MIDRTIIQSGYYAFKDGHGSQFIGELHIHSTLECWIVSPPTKYAPRRIADGNMEYDGTFFLLNEVEFLSDVLTSKGFRPATKRRLEELNSLYLFDNPDKAVKAYGVAS